jgi:uroporphyrinogen-III decarboxylase
VFEFVVEMELRFARFQVELGADLIGVGDAAASLVGPKFYDEFVWPYEKKLVDALHVAGIKTRLHICGNTRRMLAGMGRVHCSIVELDSLSPVSEARERMGPEQVLLGNIHPVRVLKGERNSLTVNPSHRIILWPTRVELSAPAGTPLRDLLFEQRFVEELAFPQARPTSIN